MLALVPVSVAAGAILGSASRWVADDIEAVRRDSLSRVGRTVAAQAARALIRSGASA
jgi:hypothetical protein